MQVGAVKNEDLSVLILSSTARNLLMSKMCGGAWVA